MSAPVGITADIALLSGCDDSSLVAIRQGAQVHRLQAPAVAAWQRLQQAGVAAGFRPAIASSYRSQQRQLQIWNDKATGRRPVLDADEQPLAIADLSPVECLEAILHWSAIPGLSRHHWGTDLDIYEESLLPAGYQLQLCQHETCGDGVLAEFYQWLEGYLAGPGAADFYRPYATDVGGVAVEPWHLSFWPLAQHYERQLGLPLARQIVSAQAQNMVLAEYVLADFDRIYCQFVLNQQTEVL